MVNPIKIIFLFLIAASLNASAQCGTVISTFPYTEGFETSAAWTTGGANNDWAWGTPAHPTVNSAGGGVKCWMAGGLTGSFYNYSELAWIMSPCFDFTSLNYPWISFKIFWEDEYHYDGLVLQYSLNGGTTWTNVGAYGDAVNCLNDNWYNYANITWITSAVPKNGWTGRTGATSGSCQGGNGSLGWVTAKHCMSALANQPSVRFRFLFGAGTTCNNYDGIAVDDVLISDAPANVANFTYACAGANTVNFTNTSLLCPTGYLWDFGDGATSTTTNPSHTYAAPGTYNVTLTSSGPCNAPGSVTIPVSILGATTTSTNVLCGTVNTGTATVIATGNAGPFVYSWSPGGQTTATDTALASGTYTVTVSATNSCSASATAVVNLSAGLNVSASSTAVNCFGGSDGTVTAVASNGVIPYTYLWAGGGNSATYANLTSGNYSVTVTDLNGCTGTASTTVLQPLTALSVSSNSTPVSCFGGSNGSVIVTASGGTAPYTYMWTGGPASAVYSNIAAGTYTATATDFNGCTANVNATVTQPSSALSVTATAVPVGCYGGSNGSATAVVSGGSSPYTYSWAIGGAVTATASGLTIGTYTVTVTDINLCTTNTTAIVTQPNAPVTANTTTTQALCALSNGTATVNASGGTSPYTYSWAPSGGTGMIAAALGVGTYTVTVTDFNNCTVTSAANITSNGNIVATILSTPINCNGESNGAASASATGGASPYSFLWSTGTANATVSNLSPGNYCVTAVDANGCSDTACIDLFNPSPVIAGFTSNPTVTGIDNPDIYFYDNSQGAALWQWDFGDNSGSTGSNPNHDYTIPGTYPVTLIVTNNHGCQDSVTHYITINSEFTFYAPTAFSPNSNEINDIFLPKGTGWDNSSFEMSIYDRWGNMVFNTTDPLRGWDGKSNGGNAISQIDVYVWKVKLSELSGKGHRFMGSVTILR